VRIEDHATVPASPARVWQVVTEPANYPQLLAGATRWETTGEQRIGLGARYRVLMTVGSAEVGGLVEVVEFDEPWEMAWTSVLGIEQRGRWRLSPRDDGGTDVTLRLAYQAPGGALAGLADLLAAPTIKANVAETLRRLGEWFGQPGEAQRRGVVARAATALDAGAVLARTGVVRPTRPDRVVRSLLSLRRWGFTPAAGIAASAERFPDQPAIIDEAGTLTFAELHRRTNRLANALAVRAVDPGDGVAIMCRNHRGFIESAVAASKLGARILLVNTGFAGPQLARVLDHEDPGTVVHDAEFAAAVAEAAEGRRRVVAWGDTTDGAAPTLESLIAEGDERGPDSGQTSGSFVLLTSGTTGTPKGAQRSAPSDITPAVSVLSALPLRARERILITPPLFHGWGFLHFTLGVLLSATFVLHSRFEPEATLADIDALGVTAAPLVPVMARRILDLPDDVLAGADTSSLRVLGVSGGRLSPEQATALLATFGDVVYNLYGSTEVAWATVASPRDLRDAPGTAGRPPRGTRVAVLDEDGAPVATGGVGGVYVANELPFEGYTGGGSKETVGEFMATGDLGYLDEAGRLFVVGRDDEMIVSGGENVYPQEVEECLLADERVREAAVTGVDDPEWGQRLAAYVVTDGTTGTAGLDAEAVRARVKTQLAGYKAPRDVVFVDTLPRTETGKVLKHRLGA
jgi:fatty-acyl-CoA synthase